MPQIFRLDGSKLYDASLLQIDKMLRAGQIIRHPFRRGFQLVSRRETLISRDAESAKAILGGSQNMVAKVSFGNYQHKFVNPVDEYLFAGFRGFLYSERAAFDREVLKAVKAIRRSAKAHVP